MASNSPAALLSFADSIELNLTEFEGGVAPGGGKESGEVAGNSKMIK